MDFLVNKIEYDLGIYDYNHLLSAQVGCGLKWSQGEIEIRDGGGPGRAGQRAEILEKLGGLGRAGPQIRNFINF